MSRRTIVRPFFSLPQPRREQNEAVEEPSDCVNDRGVKRYCVIRGLRYTRAYTRAYTGAQSRAMLG